MKRYHPLKELLAARVLEFVREPAAVFWVYGFPLILTIGLGIAFRNRPVDLVYVDVEEGRWRRISGSPVPRQACNNLDFGELNWIG
jgi:hypothetical protein